MGTSSDATWCANTSSEGLVNGKSWNFFFSFFFTYQIVQAQPSGTRHDGGSHTMAIRRAVRRQRCGQQHTAARLATAQRRHDEQRGWRRGGLQHTAARHATARRRYDEQHASDTGSSNTVRHDAATRRRRDEQHGSGGKAGSSTPPQDTQPPDVDTTSSAPATRAAAAQCSTTSSALARWALRQ